MKRSTLSCLSGPAWPMVLCALVGVLTGSALAASTEVSVQLNVPGAQSPEAADVDGFRVSFLRGENRSVRGFDLGILSLSESSEFSGFSMIWGIGRVKKRSAGLAAAFVNVHSGEDSGVNAAFVNSVKSLSRGVNLGFVNFTDGASDVDVGALTISDRSRVQLGFVNFSKRIDGLQIGFLNIADNGIFPVLPLFNFPKK